ncbi:MAG: PLDc N-terminal domain-containing protein [Desulfovibrio sp.]|jgi:hypothetical protein|nr:PLDc N-terminal domain-containing protein [Desulfovibrio sp.]
MTLEWWHLALALAPLAFSFWCIWDIWSHAFPSVQRQAFWLALVVFLPVVGGVVYICRGRRQALP